jgi:hypothetical protein
MLCDRIWRELGIVAAQGRERVKELIGSEQDAPMGHAGCYFSIDAAATWRLIWVRLFSLG